MSNALSQKNDSHATLNHFLRKSRADTLLFPGDTIFSAHLLINLPDSIYDQSEIKVKKFNYQDIRRISIDLTGENSIVRTVQYTLKGRRKAEKFLTAMMIETNSSKEMLEQQKPLRINGVIINFDYTVEKRNHYFNFLIAE
jgi:hypothetical protein